MKRKTLIPGLRSAIGGTLVGISFLLYKIRNLRRSADVPINSLQDLMRWWVTTQEGASGLAAGSAVSSVLGPSAGVSAALNTSVAVGVINRGPAPPDVPEIVNAVDAGMKVPTFEFALFKATLDVTGSYPMAVGSAALAYGTRKVGGFTQVYRTTTASAKNVATRFRTVVADNWSRVAQRPISEEEVDIPYQAMEDIEGEPSSAWLEEAAKDARRERNMTRYEEKPNEKVTPMESAEGDVWGKAGWGSATIEDGGSSWDIWPEASDPLPLTVRPSDFDAKASVLEQKEMFNNAPENLEASQTFINKLRNVLVRTQEVLD